MSVEELIAEFKSLPRLERQRLAHAILSDEGSWIQVGPAVVKETVSEPAKGAVFSERWTGKFTLPEPDPDEARLAYLLDRCSLPSS